MSLKAFHLVFVASAILMCFGLGAWAYGEYQAHHQSGILALGVGSGLAGLVLMYYARAFLKKLKAISSL